MGGDSKLGGTPLGRVRGLGASHHGTGHWLQQRATALANAGLFTWLLVSLIRLPLGDFSSVMQWMGSPWVTIPMLLLLISLFWHIRLGLQVVIEDYVHGDGAKWTLLTLLNFACVAGFVFGVFSVLKIAFLAPIIGALGAMGNG